MKYRRPELAAEMSTNNRHMVSYARETGKTTKTLIETFLEATKDIGLTTEEESTIIKDPIEYFSDTFDGVLSDKHIVIFLKLASGEFDFAKEDIFELALFLRNYSKMKKNAEREYSRKELILTSIALNVIDIHLNTFETQRISDAQSDEEQLEMVAYLTNWLTKIKLHAAETNNTEYPSLHLSDTSLEQHFSRAVAEAQKLLGVSLSYIQDIDYYSTHPSNREEELAIFERSISEKEKAIVRSKSIERLLSNLSSSETDILHILSEGGISWTNFLEHVVYNQDQFEGGKIPERVMEVLNKVEQKIERNEINEEHALRILSALTAEGGDTKKEKMTVISRLRQEQDDLRVRQDMLEKTYYSFNEENFRDSFIEVKRRIHNKDTFPAADLYLLKGIYCVLYLLYKADRKGIPHEQVMQGLFEGESDQLKIKSKGFETKDASVIYFDGGTALHYYKKQMAFIYMVARNIYDQKKQYSAV